MFQVLLLQETKLRLCITMRPPPVRLACLSWPEVSEEVFLWLESVVSVLLCTKRGFFYKSCYSKLRVLLWRSQKKMFTNVPYMLESVTQMWFLDVFSLLRCSNGVSPGAQMGVMATERWERRAALLKCLVSLKTKTPGCMWQLLLDAFKFMILQQGPSRWRCGGMYYLQCI